MHTRGVYIKLSVIKYKLMPIYRYDSRYLLGIPNRSRGQLASFKIMPVTPFSLVGSLFITHFSVENDVEKLPTLSPDCSPIASPTHLCIAADVRKRQTGAAVRRDQKGWYRRLTTSGAESGW